MCVLMETWERWRRAGTEGGPYRFILLALLLCAGALLSGVAADRLPETDTLILEGLRELARRRPRLAWSWLAGYPTRPRLARVEGLLAGFPGP